MKRLLIILMLIAVSFAGLPWNPQEVNYYTNATSLNSPYSVTTSGNYVYVASSSGSLTTFNITNPATPVQTAYYTNTTSLAGAFSVTTSGNYLYVVSMSRNSLTTFNITSPANPIQIAYYTNATSIQNPRSVTTSGNYLYVASVGSDSLTTFNITNPANPVQAAYYTNAISLISAVSVTASGNYLYVASYNGDSLTTFNITNPANPVQVAYYTNATSLDGAASVTTSGNYLYVASYSGDSLTTFNITNPANPVQTAYYTNATSLDYAWSVTTSGNYLYVASLFGDSLTTFNITNPANPVQVAYYTNATSLNGAASVTTSGNYLYVASNDGNSLTTFDISPPSFATGGTITTSGNYTIHTFTSNGTFTVNVPMNVEYLVVAGGGAGGKGASGGGGAGGYLAATGYPVSAGEYSIIVGNGAAAGTNLGANGHNSTFDSITAIGGGGGSSGDGVSGGSGGGGGWTGTSGGAGTPGQGNDGGRGHAASCYPPGGGGGAGAVGSSPANGDDCSSQNGGIGVQNSISGTATYYAGGGGASGSIQGAAPGVGGLGGGGTGSVAGIATAGAANTGGGGGGTHAQGTPGAGGSGIVIIRYLTQGAAPPTITASNFSVGHGSTNFSAIADLSNVTNLTLATPKGKIKFAENHIVNATGQDYDSKIIIGNGFISVNSSGLSPSFNSSATLTINNVSCPATVYYASGFFNSSESVIAQKKICNSTTDPSCTNITCSDGNLTFTVSHFTGFAYGATANLTIWDETDSGMPNGNQMKYISQNIRFFTNYSNSTSEPITGATCQIWFTDSGWNAMNWNSTNLYEYTRIFTSGGSFDWNVSCNKSGQATLDANDTVLVNSTIAVVLNSPADNAIVKSSVILYNWSVYGFPGDPTCNLTRNGSVVYSATCTNNALCGYTNSTANGEYIWNVTCYSGATTRTSSTRALTVNTLYHSTNVEGVLNMNITEISSISLPQNTISFGTVEITQTYDSYPSQFFVIKNDGNTIVDIEVNATNPFLSSNCTFLPCSAYQVKVGANETIPYPICSGNPSKESYTNMFGSSSGLLINDFNFVDNDDSANIYIKFRLPNDEPPGSKSSTVTFWAKSVNSYACD